MIDHAVVLQYINAFGFPVCVSLALGWALVKIGGRLIESHFDLIVALKQQGNDIVKELKTQSDLLSKWPSDPMTTMGCKIDSPSGLDAFAKSVAGHVKLPRGT